jgi:hypothetical protein
MDGMRDKKRKLRKTVRSWKCPVLWLHSVFLLRAKYQQFPKKSARRAQKQITLYLTSCAGVFFAAAARLVLRRSTKGPQERT